MRALGSMSGSYGPAFRWFAWHPTFTHDRGWRWLRFVWRRRFFLDLAGEPAMSWFETTVREPEAVS